MMRSVAVTIEPVLVISETFVPVFVTAVRYERSSRAFQTRVRNDCSPRFLAIVRAEPSAPNRSQRPARDEPAVLRIRLRRNPTDQVDDFLLSRFGLERPAGEGAETLVDVRQIRTPPHIELAIHLNQPHRQFLPLTLLAFFEHRLHPPQDGGIVARRFDVRANGRFRRPVRLICASSPRRLCSSDVNAGRQSATAGTVAGTEAGDGGALIHPVVTVRPSVS